MFLSMLIVIFQPGKTEIVDLLLSAPGINVNARDNTGYGRNYTPLHVAAKVKKHIKKNLHS